MSFQERQQKILFSAGLRPAQPAGTPAAASSGVNQPRRESHRSPAPSEEVQTEHNTSLTHTSSWRVHGEIHLYISSNTPTKCTHIYLHNSTFTTFLLHVSVCYTSSSGRATCISAQNHGVTCVIKKKHVVLSRNTSSPPEDGVYYTEKCSRNVVNILLYKYICEFSWYIWGVRYENTRNRKLQN